MEAKERVAPRAFSKVGIELILCQVWAVISTNTWLTRPPFIGFHPAISQLRFPSQSAIKSLDMELSFDPHSLCVLDYTDYRDRHPFMDLKVHKRVPVCHCLT